MFRSEGGMYSVDFITSKSIWKEKMKIIGLREQLSQLLVNNRRQAEWLL